AARQGDVTSARLLVEKGADVNEPAPGGLTPLLVAADGGQEAFSIFLAEKGANPNVADPLGLTPLHHALRRGLSLISAIHVGGGYPYPYSYLLRPDMPELVKALLEHGANPNARITGLRTKLDVEGTNAADRPQAALARRDTADLRCRKRQC